MARPEPVVWDPTADPEEQAERMRALALDVTRHPMERAAAVVVAGRHVTEVAKTSRAVLFAELANERAAKEQAVRERDLERAAKEQAVRERDLERAAKEQAVRERDAAIAAKGRQTRL